MQQTVKDTLIELSKKDANGNIEWVNRFANYATDIEANIDKLKEAAKKFHNWKPFNIYLNLSQTKDNSDVFVFSLRYIGQEVADIKVNLKDGTVLIDTTKYDQHNKDYFDCQIELKNIDWSKEQSAKAFRKYFAELDMCSVSTHSKEHEYESLLLTEFNKSPKTQFKGIKPISIIKARFPMKTPLLASDKKGVKIESRPGRGGGIDLFTRTKVDGQVRLNVMELKDEYSNSEPPQKVIRQAIKYAVFIQQLLRSGSGEVWWKLFGFSKPLPEKLIINATCIIPTNKKGSNDTSFGGERIAIDCNDEIELHYIYFEEVDGSIMEKESSLCLK